jgi:hypothetical protein
MTPKEELKELLEKLAEKCLDNIDQYGWHIPMCWARGPTGDRYIFVADSKEPEDETEDRPYDHAAAVKSICHQVRKHIAEGKLRSVALAKNVQCTLETPEGRVQADAVKIALDHERGGGYVAYLTYEKEEGKARPKNIYYEELTERFFS